MSGCTCDHNPHKASCPSYGEDYLAHPDTPVRVDWWWTAEGRAAHDVAIRAEALEEAADGVDVMRHIGVQTDFAQWLRNRAAALRAAQPTEGES